MRDKPVYTQEMADGGEAVPIGCLCSISNCGNAWMKVTLLYLSGAYVICRDEDCFEQHYHRKSVEIRPLPEPTERDKAIADIESTIRAMEYKPSDCKNIATVLYNDGYRKPKPKDEQLRIIRNIMTADRPYCPQTIYNALNGGSDA